MTHLDTMAGGARRRRRFHWRRGAVVLALASLACGRGQSDSAGQTAVGVRMVTAAPTSFTETVDAIGVVAGRPGHVAALSAPAVARVARVMVAVGQHVSRGTSLIELDPTPFVSAGRAAEAALAAAQRAYERTSTLVAQGIAPRKDLDVARSDLEQARAAAVNARRQQQLSRISAPISGVITRVSASIGATVDPAQVLVEIADPSALDLLFTVTAGQAGRVRTGAKVTVTAGQSAGGEPLGVATVVDIGGIVDTLSRGVVVRAQAPTTRRPLRIGETVYGEIVVGVYPDAIVLPIDALVPEGEGFKVFVVDQAGIAHARPVRVGGRTGALAHIVSGVAPGERVVTYGAYGLDDSTKVAPLPAPAPTPAP